LSQPEHARCSRCEQRFRNGRVDINILFLAQLLPYPLDSGGKIKSYHFLQALAEKHTVTLVSFVRSEQEAESAGTLKQFCDQIETVLLPRSKVRDLAWLLRSLVNGKSFIISRDWAGEFRSRVNDLLSKHPFDVIHVVRANMFQYVPADPCSYVVLDTENVEAQVVRRTFESKPFTVSGFLSLFESKRLEEYERMVCAKADLVLTVTEEDKDALSAHMVSMSGKKTRSTPIDIVPIGVDTGYFAYSWRPHPDPRAVLVGTMYWPPNVDCAVHFCRDILPLARKEIPELAFEIVGLRPTKKVVRLQQRLHGVRVTGSVEDVRPYMLHSRVFVVPLRAGSGMRVKILNAMAVGIPVVTTSIGCEGIDGLVQVQQPLAGHDNRDANIWVADSPHEFARAVVTLMTNDGIARTLSRNGRTLMETVYDWSIIRNRILDLYDRIEQEIPSRRVTRMPADCT
jgi:sugar transferase (PEP-CTERM/EpsH1 system associated)